MAFALVFSFCAFFYRGKIFLSLAFILALGLGLRIYVASDPYLHDWDERFHALVARNMSNHPLVPTLYENPVLPIDSSTWVDGHIWLHKQPLPLWFMAGSIKMFGINEYAVRLPSVLFSTLTILLVFFIGRNLFNKRTGLIAAFLTGIHGLIIELTGGRVATDHIDILFLFFTTLGVHFAVLYSKRKNILYSVLTGVAIGLAVLCKWLPAYIVFLIWIILTYRRTYIPKIIAHSVIILTSSLIIFLPWQIYILNMFPAVAKQEYSYNLRHFTEVLDGNYGPFYYYLEKVRILFGEVIYIPLIWLIVKIFRRFESKRVALLSWILVPTIFFSLAKTKMQGYIIFCAPAFFLLTAYFLVYVQFIRRRFKYPNTLLILCFVLFLGLPFRYSFERVKPFSDSEEERVAWTTRLKKLKDRFPVKTIIFNEPRNIEAMFFTGYTAYNKVPTPEEIKSLIGRGYTVVISNKPDVEKIEYPGVIYLD